MSMTERNVCLTLSFGTWPSQILVSRKITGFDFPGALTSSRTLLIYIYVPNDDINYRTERHAERHKLDILFQAHTEAVVDNQFEQYVARRQLEHLWEQKVFDVIILEVAVRNRC